MLPITQVADSSFKKPKQSKAKSLLPHWRHTSIGPHLSLRPQGYYVEIIMRMRMKLDIFFVFKLVELWYPKESGLCDLWLLYFVMKKRWTSLFNMLDTTLSKFGCWLQHAHPLFPRRAIPFCNFLHCYQLHNAIPCLYNCKFFQLSGQLYHLRAITLLCSLQILLDHFRC